MHALATPRPPLPAACWIFAATVLLQLPLALNPGYFSHDELQWAVHAAGDLRAPWLDLATFQYRPLTFSLWMLLSRALFDTPMLFHTLLVAWGALNAALLFALARGFGLRAWPAACGALAFALSPYAAYTHGWIGCIADLAWVGCALAIGLAVQRTRSAIVGAIAAALLTLVALLAKEAAFAIPPLLLVAWWFDARRPTWLAAMLASGTVAALYLAVRLDALLDAPREGAQYSLSLLHMPMRWFEYQVFPSLVPLLETFTVTHRPLPLLVASVLWLAMFAAVLAASRRLAALYLAGGIAALLPVLPLASSFNHYAYGFAALAAMTVAAAWPHAARRGRIAIAVFAALTLAHGVAVMARMHEVGRIQAVFSPALAAAVQADGAVALQLHPDATAWVFRRLTHDIPRYRGVAIGARARIVDAGMPADYRVLPDGRLQRLN